MQQVYGVLDHQATNSNTGSVFVLWRKCFARRLLGKRECDLEIEIK